MFLVIILNLRNSENHSIIINKKIQKIKKMQFIKLSLNEKCYRLDIIIDI